MTEYILHPEWPHIHKLRKDLLAELAIQEALREGRSEIEGLEIEVEVKGVENGD